MDKKIIVVEAHNAESIRNFIDDTDGGWDVYDIVIVQSGELKLAENHLETSLPDGKEFLSVDIKDLVK